MKMNAQLDVDVVALTVRPLAQDLGGGQARRGWAPGVSGAGAGGVAGVEVVVVHGVGPHAINCRER